MEQMTGDRLSDLDLQLDNEVRTQLSETGKWTKFISVAIFICCGLLAILLVVASTTLMSIFERYGGARFSGFGDITGGFVMGVGIFMILILATVYFFMFRFSSNIKTALQTENTNTLNSGISSLKTFFIITSILGVISLLFSVYSLFFINSYY